MGGTDLLIRFIGLDLVSRVAERAGNSVDRLQNRINRSGIASAQSFIAAGIAMTTAGVSVLALAAGLTYLAGTSIEAAAQFRSDMVMVVTHAKLAADQIDVVSKALMDMAPAVGFGPDALAQAFYHVQSATSSLYTDGLPHTAEKLEILRQAAELAAVGHADLTATTNTLISVLAAYHDKNLSAADAAAQLNSIVGFGNVTLSQFDAAMRGGLLPIAAQTGITIASLGAAFGVLTDEGYGASQAATYLRSAIIQMSMPSGPAAKALEAIGLSGEKVAKQMGYFNEVLNKAGINQTELANELSKSGSLSQTLDMLRQKLIAAGLSGQQASALIERSFGGIRSGAGVVGLMDNLTSLAAKEKGIAQSTSEWAATWKYFQSNDPAFVIKQMQAAFEVLRITIGNALMPTFLRLANTIMPMLARLRDFISGHADIFAKLVLGAIAFAAILGTLLVVAGGIAIIGGSIGIVGGAIAGFVGLLSGPIIVAALVFAGVAYLVATHWNQVAKLFDTYVLPVLLTLSYAWQSFTRDLARGEDFFQALGGVLSLLGMKFSDVNGIVTTLRAVWHDLGDQGRSLMGIVRGIWEWLGHFFKMSLQITQQVLPVMHQAFDRIVGVLGPLNESFFKLVQALLGVEEPARKGAGQLNEVALKVGGVHGATKAFTESGAIFNLIAFFAVDLPAAILAAVNWLVFFIDNLRLALSIMTTSIKVAGDLARGDFKKAWQDMSQGASDQAEIIKQTGRDLSAAMTSTTELMDGTIERRHQAFAQTLQNTWQGIYDGTVDKHSAMVDRHEQLTEEMIQRTRSHAAEASNVGVAVGAALGDGMTAGFNSRMAALQAAIAAGIGNAYMTAQSTGLISSPSRLFARGVGLPIAQGIAAGIDQGVGLPKAAVARSVTDTYVHASGVQSESASSGSDSDTRELLARAVAVLEDIRRDGRSNSRLPAGSDNSNLLSSVAQALAEKGARGRRAGMRAVYA